MCPSPVFDRPGHHAMRGGIRDPLKRAFDITIASLLLIITSPIQLAAAIAIRIRLGSPVLFRQTRPGLHAQPFEIVKFRTMLGSDPAPGVADDPARITPLGRWLRASSIDELPTLWNIISGHMSLVGPRPLMTQYLGLYSAEQARRHEVRPGITGLAQVSGRNALSWQDRFRLDIYYVDHHSFAGDLKIIGRTVLSVAMRDGIAPEGEATMPEFFGNDEQEQRR
jgi:lipopolysaccharide/colanic/teichoic acid biosynthesis glycosyltransferase